MGIKLPPIPPLQENIYIYIFFYDFTIILKTSLNNLIFFRLS